MESPGLRREGDGVNHQHKSLPRSRSKPLNDVLLNSVLYRRWARGDGSPGVSEGCETCSTGSSCQGTACTIRVICCQGGATGPLTTISERLQKLQEEVQSPAPAPVQPPDWGAQVASNRWSTLCSRSGTLLRADSGREGRCVVARNCCQTTHATGSRPRTAHPCRAHHGPRRAFPVAGRQTGGYEGRICRVNQERQTTSPCCGELLARGGLLRTECCLWCHEALVLECERQVRVAGGPDWRGSQPRSSRQAPPGTEIAGIVMSWDSDTESTPILSSHNPAAKCSDPCSGGSVHPGESCWSRSPRKGHLHPSRTDKIPLHP